MMKKITLTFVLALCVVVMTACQSKETERFQVATVPTQNVAIPMNTTAVINTTDDFNYDDYDPASEENSALDEVINIPLNATNEPVILTPAPTMNSEYAGATPVVIDPIDKPTPTPVPPISFEFTNYALNMMHLSFDGPAGWTAEETADTFVLKNTASRADWQASITIHTSVVNGNYSDSQLKTEVSQYMDTLRSDYYSKMERSNIDKRTLMGENGRYANYTATTRDGVQVAGRVMLTCIDRTLYFVHFTYPAAYKNTYESSVCTKLRNTLKQVN